MAKLDLIKVHHVDTDVPYMEIEGEKFYFSTQNEVFLNSQCLFVAYTDVVKSPAFNFIYRILQYPENFSKNYEIEQFRGFDATSLVEWFMNRKNQNPIMEILRPEYRDKIPLKAMDEFLNKEYELYPILVKEAPWLNAGRMIEQLISEKVGIVKKIVIWYPYENPVIQEDLKTKYGSKVHLFTGPLKECIQDIPTDSTYILSEVTDIEILLQEGKLKHSSILIPEDYQYNFTKDRQIKIDYSEYLEEELFKLSFFNATEIVED